ncbi:Putative Zn-dependent protease, contains TPR repeats [Nitrosomonas aestuarii]|uniref:Putative Zn-dependent protease, contains TPR repeats n=1 Tax=Nitrosomonas aestuarii TaxID=52441 RepID=A0A1I4CV90_9PROT|nr:M48 family metalloprotease [Nitrosomonas aestuarii]SFK84825.1 Putative Zn-dependent protease, contains TPR repeats [Nitrosomonas aestuarii]
MRFIFFIITLSLLFPANMLAHELPDLGDVSQATITPREERQIGLQIMRQIRADPSYLDDPEINSYLNSLGHKLISSSSEARPGQSFEFFALQDSSINAFALPGGFMGFNSGLIIAAQSESELAGVMAHEIAHVTQKHLARMISGQKYSMITSLAALAVAILASRSNPQVGQAVITATQASAIQSQLNFTRKHEKEADRVGLNILVDAGFDPQGMSAFFERLQKASRFYENGAPSYLRTHPLTFERIADIQNRTHEMAYRQVPDSTDFLLVRAKLRALQGKSSDAVSQFKARLEDKRYTNEAIERYGYIHALLRDKKNRLANDELARLYTLIQNDGKSGLILKDHQLGKTIQVEQKSLQAGAMVETLAAAVKLANGETADALNIYRTALRIYPQHKALIHGYANALLQNNQIETALELINRELRIHSNDIQLYQLQARTYSLQDKLMLKHRAQAEVYILQGYYDAAIEQLLIALKHDNGDFYQLSTVEARLHQLQKFMEEEKEE